MSWDGLVLRHDHPWWRTHFPPGGWGCRCYVTATSTREAERSGKREAPDDGTYRYTDRWGKVHELPRGIDYGWAHAPGATWQPDMRRYPPEIARGLRRDLESARDVPTRLSAPALRLALREAERQFSGEVEQASAFAPDGTLVLSKRGAFDSIEFTPAELSSLSGAVLTHSHPGVGSFSREDVALAAAYEVAEIRAVDEYFVYSLRTLGFSWDWHWWNRRAKPVVAQVRAEIDARLREARVTGKMTEEEFEAEYWHEIWQTVALQLNLRYRRKARR